MITKTALATLLCALLPLSGRAQAQDDTLQKIKAGAPIKVGYRAASVPFSMREGGAPPTGYTLDLCARIIDSVRKELAMPDLGAIAQGASVAPLLSGIDRERALGIQYVRVKDFREGFDALESGRAAAFVSDDIQFAEFLARSSHPQDYVVVGEALSVDPLGIMMRKQDGRLHAIANRTLAGLAASGEFDKVYARWFLSSKMKFPMGDALKKLLKAPNNAPNY